MKLVIVESPFAGDIERNVRYARACMLDCIKRAEAPFAGHLLYTQPGILNDSIPEERIIGINAHLAWCEAADLTAVYDDLGVSPGMKKGIEHAAKQGRKIEFRQLEGEWKCSGR